jgi:predicted DNA repair protein MutK
MDESNIEIAVYGNLSFIVADNILHVGVVDKPQHFYDKLVESNDQAFEAALETVGMLSTLQSQLVGLYKGLAMVSMVQQPLPGEN